VRRLRRRQQPGLRPGQPPRLRRGQPDTTTAQLKDFFDAAIVGEIAQSIARVDASFDARAFSTSALTGLDRLELIARGWHIAEALHAHLPRPFPRAAEVLVASLGPELSGTEGWGMAPFRYLPHVLFVQKYGLDDLDAALRAQYELTKRFSAESSIRPYLVRYQRETYATLQRWARDDSAHVRRLVSEGSRPRLPWAPRLRAYQEDPQPVIALLELLKDDADRYVQRSVANNLNDIGKDHPDVAVAVCRAWLEQPTPGRRWIVGHALRSLVKRGHRGALQLLGVGGKSRVRIRDVRVAPKRARIGGAVEISFELVSAGSKAQELMIDYAVHFVKARGETRAKVFKLKRLTLAPKGTARLATRLSLKEMTTRKHHPGRHRVDVLINGERRRLTEFELR
jgi:3-methyladenine DNA glycosylase AlkC